MEGPITAIHFNISSAGTGHSDRTVDRTGPGRQAVSRQVIVQLHRDGAVVHGSSNIVCIVGVLILCRTAQYTDFIPQLSIVGSTSVLLLCPIGFEVQSLLQSRIAGNTRNHHIRRSASRCVIFHLQRYRAIAAYRVFTTVSSHQMAVLIQHIGHINARNGITAIFRQLQGLPIGADTAAGHIVIVEPSELPSGLVIFPD
ncbi:unknown [Acidaminococcus sp. CAG:542]|nr:unknown [Acidaminococcus sp. CAG:542]